MFISNREVKAVVKESANGTVAWESDMNLNGRQRRVNDVVDLSPADR